MECYPTRAVHSAIPRFSRQSGGIRQKGRWPILSKKKDKRKKRRRKRRSTSKYHKKGLRNRRKAKEEQWTYSLLRKE